MLVEVKTRTRSDYGGAALAVDARKRARLLRAAATLETVAPFAHRRAWRSKPREDGAVVRHYRDALSDA